MYPWTALVFAFSALAAFGGFIWAWLVHVLHAGENSHSGEYFWRNFIQRLAVVLAAAVPVVNAQFLANPDWEGTLSQYITLGTLTGAAAIALTFYVRVGCSSRGWAERYCGLTGGDRRRLRSPAKIFERVGPRGLRRVCGIR